MDLIQNAVFLREGEDIFLLVVCENIDAIERRFGIGSIHKSARGTWPILARPGEDRRNKRFAIAAIFVRVPFEAFHDIPAVVLAFADDIDFFV